jgi:hypothetical protein
MPCKKCLLKNALKIYDYRLTYVQYYLLEDKMQEEVCKIFLKNYVLQIQNILYFVFIHSLMISMSHVAKS